MMSETNKNSLPEFSWQSYQKVIKEIVEGQDSFDESSILFLESIGFIKRIASGFLHTEPCSDYYDALFISNDKFKATQILRESLLAHAAVQLIMQMLRGVKGAGRNNALAILKSRCMWEYSDEKPLTNLLLLMNSVDLLTYSNKHGTIKVESTPNSEHDIAPNNMFIEPDRPYSNAMWLNKVLRESSGYIYWIDKHFSAEGLEFLWENRNANKVKKIHIISLFIDDLHGKRVLKKYKNLKKELAVMGIELVWYVIDSKQIRDNHDRWIISSDAAWNLPDVNSIVSGSRSEISKTPHGAEMKKAFSGYVKESKEITERD